MQPNFWFLKLMHLGQGLCSRSCSINNLDKKIHCKCLHPECNQGCKFWVQQILFAIFAIDIWNCCNYLLLQFYDAKIYVSVCRVCKLKLHIWLQKLAAIIDCNNCIQSATGHVTLVKVAVLATKTFTVWWENMPILQTWADQVSLPFSLFMNILQCVFF